MFHAVDLGALNISYLRLVIIGGLIRAFLKREFRALQLNTLDRILILLSAWTMAIPALRYVEIGGFIYRAGFVINSLGVYFLTRAWNRTYDDFRYIAFALTVSFSISAPVMIYEAKTGQNAFSILGNFTITPGIRNGRIRAQGAFLHSILAGTAAAVSIGIILLQRPRTILTKFGAFAALTAVLATASSGPIMTTVFLVASVLFWRFRLYLSHVKVAFVFIYFAAEIYMTRPAYYILEKIDLTGSSTGYHRAALIEAALKHINEWWLFGTNITRHWMATGIIANESASDITNHYLAQGANSGVLATFLVGLSIYVSLSRNTVWKDPRYSTDDQFTSWLIGSIIVAHSITMLTIAYFDHSIVFLYIPLALVSAIPSSKIMSKN